MNDDTPTAEERAAWARLCEAATRGPWIVRIGHEDEDHEHVDDPDGVPIAIVEIGENDAPDPAFIAVARLALPRLLRALEAAEQRERALERQLAIAVEALEFYADPETYFAIAFFGDPPYGPFIDDFSTDGDDDRERPGKLARAVLDKDESKLGKLATEYDRRVAASFADRIADEWEQAYNAKTFQPWTDADNKRCLSVDVVPDRLSASMGRQLAELLRKEAIVLRGVCVDDADRHT